MILIIRKICDNLFQKNIHEKYFFGIHVHAEKADMECKFWLLIKEVEIKEVFSYNLTPSAKKEIKKIIYQHFDLIV